MSDENSVLPEILKYEKFIEEEISTPKKPQLPPLESKYSLKEVLNRMFEPITILDSETNEFVTYQVSTSESLRYELQDLEEKVAQLLRVRKARKNGICPIRENVYMQLFDEIIRQTTINCVERGQLLLRVRNHLNMTFAAYKTLYQGSVVFGTRKQLLASMGMPELESRIKELEAEKMVLENKVKCFESENQFGK